MENKPIVELEKNKNGSPYGGKTFYFVDPIFKQLCVTHPDLAKQYFTLVNGGWMDYNSCVDLTCNFVEIKWVEKFSPEIQKMIEAQSGGGMVDA